MKIQDNWKLQTLPFDEKLNDAMRQQHHAAQFIALVGRYLIPQQPDDSNTNMEFVPDRDMFVGNAMPGGLRVALQITDLRISILDQENDIKKDIYLEGKTKHEVFDELKQNLSGLGVDVSSFKNELHYEIPAHAIEQGAVFSINDKRYFTENAIYRHNAKIVLNEIAGIFEQDEPIRIWPHHFDTGAFFAISKNKKGEATQTIGIGLAIPDSMVDEPYYYLSFWSEKPEEGLDKLKPLGAGKWMMPDWNGAVLKHSEILKAGTAIGQHELVKSFFNSGIKKIIDHYY